MAFVNVEGVVSRLHNSGGGFGLKESWQVQGKDRHKFWAVFPKDAVQVSEGDRVKVSGGLQTSVTDPKPDSQGEMRTYVDHVVGQAKVEVVEARGGGSNAAWGAGAGQQSNMPSNGAQDGFGGLGDEEPF